jgi:hypothetical protein
MCLERQLTWLLQELVSVLLVLAWVLLVSLELWSVLVLLALQDCILDPSILDRMVASNHLAWLELAWLEQASLELVWLVLAWLALV